jgi:hypothetical protein
MPPKPVLRHARLRLTSYEDEIIATVVGSGRRLNGADRDARHRPIAGACGYERVGGGRWAMHALQGHIAEWQTPLIG